MCILHIIYSSGVHTNCSDGSNLQKKRKCRCWRSWKHWSLAYITVWRNTPCTDLFRFCNFIVFVNNAFSSCFHPNLYSCKRPTIASSLWNRHLCTIFSDLPRNHHELRSVLINQLHPTYKRYRKIPDWSKKKSHLEIKESFGWLLLKWSTYCSELIEFIERNLNGEQRKRIYQEDCLVLQ